MAVYLDDRGIFTYVYKISSRQITEDVSYVEPFVYYVRKNGLYWIERNIMYCRFNNITNTVLVSDDLADVIQFIVVNNNTNILIKRGIYQIQHNEKIRFTDELADDFDLYDNNIIRNNNKLFCLYNFNSIGFDIVPIDSEYYIKYDNRHFLGIHNYINQSNEHCLGCNKYDIEKLFEIVYNDNGLYYVIKNQYKAFLVDYVFSDKNISDVQTANNHVMIYYGGTVQYLYHVGVLYTVPVDSRLKN